MEHVQPDAVHSRHEGDVLVLHVVGTELRRVARFLPSREGALEIVHLESQMIRLIALAEAAGHWAVVRMLV